MRRTELKLRPWNISRVLAIAASLLAWPAVGAAQTVTGQAAGVQATVFSLLGGTTLGLANTGALSGPTDALRASQLAGNLPLAALTAEVPSATTIGYPDQVNSVASLANLALSIAGSTIGADLLTSRAMATLNGGGAGSSSVSNLLLNGAPVPVSGAPNQMVSIPGGQMVINEQLTSPTGIVVNALHITVGGVADVVIGSALAGIQ